MMLAYYQSVSYHRHTLAFILIQQWSNIFHYFSSVFRSVFPSNSRTIIAPSQLVCNWFCFHPPILFQTFHSDGMNIFGSLSLSLFPSLSSIHHFIYRILKYSLPSIMKFLTHIWIYLFPLNQILNVKYRMLAFYDILALPPRRRTVKVLHEIINLLINFLYKIWVWIDFMHRLSRT